MSTRTILIGVLALTFGGSAAVGVNLLYHQGPGDLRSDSVTVAVAARDVPRGSMITADMVKSEEVPKDLIPVGAITQLDDVIDRVAFSSVVENEPFIKGKMSEKHAKGGLAGLVPKGMRAFAIQTPHVATQIAGFILPGNKVDVLLTMNGGGPNDVTGGGATTTLLQNVEIMAVDQHLDAPSDNKVDTRTLQSVTLLVTPDQAAKLDLGQNRGILHLSLRNPTDVEAANARPATISQLQFNQEKPWAQQAKEVIEALAKWREQPTSKESTAPVTVAQDLEPAPPLEIRTLRGTHGGVVLLEPLPSAGRGR
jgi:pilus assembly protein CpaB